MIVMALQAGHARLGGGYNAEPAAGGQHGRHEARRAPA